MCYVDNWEITWHESRTYSGHHCRWSIRSRSPWESQSKTCWPPKFRLITMSWFSERWLTSRIPEATNKIAVRQSAILNTHSAWYWSVLVTTAAMCPCWESACTAALTFKRSKWTTNPAGKDVQIPLFFRQKQPESCELVASRSMLLTSWKCDMDRHVGLQIAGLVFNSRQSTH